MRTPTCLICIIATSTRPADAGPDADELKARLAAYYREQHMAAVTFTIDTTTGGRGFAFQCACKLGVDSPVDGRTSRVRGAYGYTTGRARGG